MTRIISGAVGSLRLAGAAKATRPTSDRVKESLFSILETMDVLEGAHVLDLYAGTGALGLEAASRGARSVTFVESNSAAAKICFENLSAVRSGLSKQGLEPALKLFTEPVSRFLKRDFEATLAFVDPPYELGNAELLEQLKLLSGRDLLIVLERSTKTPAIDLPIDFELISERSYGDTVVYLVATRFAG